MVGMAKTATTPDDRQLRREIRTLGDQLGDVLRAQQGDDAFDLVERVRALAKARRKGDRAAEKTLIRLLGSLDTDTIAPLIQALSVFFDLANLAEDRHRVRVLRQRDQARGPRRESLAMLAETFRKSGASAEEVQQTLNRAVIELVFTAHPTEAKRRSVREKIRDLRSHMAELDRDNLRPRDRKAILHRVQADLTGLWQTDFVRFRRPSVLEELDRSLFFASNLWRVIPRLYRDLRHALDRAYPDAHIDIPPLLTFGTWIGGDRDGNPFVTADITRRALQTLRREAISRHIEQARLARRNLSVSTQKASVSDDLLAAIDNAQLRWPAVRESVQHLSEHEPYRRWLRIVQWRLEQAVDADLVTAPPDGAFTDGLELVNALTLMRDSLAQHKGELIAEAHLDDWICQARVFGLHLMRLDVRQESTWYHDVMAEILATLGICDTYADLDEAGRQRVLSTSMPCRDAISRDSLSDNARETLDLFMLLARVVDASGPGSLGVHIISMTHAPSDMLVVLWLSQWAAAQQGLADDRLPMPIAPLFETIDDLHQAPTILDAVLQHAAYADHVLALTTGDMPTQNIMIGYSDSTKDGGYLTACWGVHAAQMNIARQAAERNVKVRFFHGRGGSLGRGGGPAARSIRSLPPGTVDVGLRVTEQGEVLSERYDDPAIAHRHLEQVAHASLLQAWGGVAADDRGAPSDDDADGEMFSHLAARARAVYRELVDSPGFIAYFEQATPITQIEQLPIGSRPSRRKAERSLTTLRAIPWVFSWTQCRHIIPAWYGLGSAIGEYMAASRSRRDELRRLYTQSQFFRATIDNAALALAKADIGIARHHAGLVENADARKRIWSMIEQEYDRSAKAVLAIIGKRRLLAEVPWLKRSIEVRNPYVDPLNLIQVELFRRLRDVPAESDEHDTIASLIRLSIQGIAGGLRTTG